MNVRTRTGLAALLIVGLAAALLSLAVLAAVAPGPRPAGAPAAAAADPSHPGGALSADEEAIKRLLLRAFATPESVTFEKWGPHLTPAEVAGWGGAGPRPDERRKWPMVYRVVYRGRSRQSGVVEQHDTLFVVRGGTAEKFEQNPAGDDWKDFFRKATR